MKKLIVVTLAVIGSLSIVLVVVAVSVGLVASLARPVVPRRTILEADFERKLVEFAPGDPIERWLRRDVLTVRDVVEALERGAADRRVVAFVARIGAAPIGLAQIQEIRDAVVEFRKSGKPAVAYAETFGEFGPGNGAYYLAAAFDTIYLQPTGDVGLTGFVYESPFVRGTLDKLGVVPRLDHRHEYKNAKNVYTETGFTEAHREATRSLMASRFQQMVRGIAEGRGLREAEVRERIDAGPHLGQEAVDAGLVDGLAYRDEVHARIEEQVGPRAKRLYLTKYLERAGRLHVRGETIALIYGVGTVVRGRSGWDALSGEMSLGADTVAAAFREAIDDRKVRAIVFRVDSPGGSFVASDTIRRETIRAREAGKPVIVSMGELAASGGYYISMSADRIVAQPATLTGSIGVYGGKLITTGMWRKLGLSWDEVHTSRNAMIWSGHQDYDPQEYARFQASLDRIYEDFTSNVARGRGLDLERVLEIARGRVWTGEEALGLGLVDSLGGFPTAIRLAKQAAGIDPEAEVRLRVLPRRPSLLESLFGEAPEKSDATLAESLERSLEALRPIVGWIRELEAASGGRQPLRMPAVELLE
jgi:protease-4